MCPSICARPRNDHEGCQVAGTQGPDVQVPCLPSGFLRVQYGDGRYERLLCGVYCGQRPMMGGQKVCELDVRGLSLGR